MGFFYNSVKSSKAPKPNKHIPIATMNAMGCNACTLDTADLVTPKMKPSGDADAPVYILGEAPGDSEDNQGRFFVGKFGQLLRSHIPAKMKKRVNNIIRCKPKADVSINNIECCRNYIVEDIENTQPRILVVTSNASLKWATGLTNLNNWRGSLIATRIGNHDMWCYPVTDPKVVHSGASNSYGKSEVERVFEWDWKQIDLLSGSSTAPDIHTGGFDEGVEVINGRGGRKDLDRLRGVLSELSVEEQVGLDIETTHLRPYYTGAKILTCSIGTFEKTVAFPLDHPDGWPVNLRGEVWDIFLHFLLGSGTKIAHKLAFELEWLCYFLGQEIMYLTTWGDTLMMSHTLDERKGIHSLDDQCRKWFGFFLKEKSNVDASRIIEFPLNDVLTYNGMDTKWTEMLSRKLMPELQKNKKYLYEYNRKLRLQPAIIRTQLRGVLVDKEYAKNLGNELRTEITDIESSIRKCPEVVKYASTYGTFSPSSPAQVISLMKNVCGRIEVTNTKGKDSSDVEVLGAIAKDGIKSASLILEHRALSKLESTYVIPVVNNIIVMPDGRMHTQYTITVAETGRLTSEDPNLQNFPKRKYKKVRRMVIASIDGSKLFFPIDYGQLEARVIAWASEDEALVKALWTSYDIHGYWADRFLSVYPSIKDRVVVDYFINTKADDADKKIRKSFRDEIKNGWVFPLFFGSAVNSCAANIKVPESIADDLSSEFWDEFRGVKKWQERVLDKYNKNLYVETLNGRRRRGVLTKNQIINHPIQGTAAEFVEEAMAEVSEYSVITGDDDYQPVLNVHDDLTFEVPNYSDIDVLFSKIENIAKIMCKHRYKFINVPVVAEVSMGKNWHKTEELHVYRSDELFTLENPYA